MSQAPETSGQATGEREFVLDGFQCPEPSGNSDLPLSQLTAPVLVDLNRDGIEQPTNGETQYESIALREVREGMRRLRTYNRMRKLDSTREVDLSNGPYG